jgi:hypothetical protein
MGSAQRLGAFSAWMVRGAWPDPAVEPLVANGGLVASPVKADSRRRRGPEASLYWACRQAILGHRGRRRVAAELRPASTSRHLYSLRVAEAGSPSNSSLANPSKSVPLLSIGGGNRGICLCTPMDKAGRGDFDQLRFLNRQLILPVSMMSQWCVSRSSMAVVILASPNTCGQSAKARFVVISSDVFS